MKKIVFLMLTLLALAFVGCQKKEEAPAVDAAATTTEAPAAPATDAAPAAPAK
ncbi:MAG: hypothetical protein ACRCSK_00095 [Fusobacteriaceae bacterium]